MRHNGGWIKLHRSLAEHPAAHDGPMLAVFMWLLLRVNWKPSRIRFGGKFIVVNPGQIVTGSTEIALALNMSRQVVRTRLAQLEQIETINRTSTNTGTLITIMNWDKYQDSSDPDNLYPTNDQPTVNQQITNGWPLSEEGKKERREEEPSGTLVPLSSAFKPSSFVDLWNEQCGTLSKATKLNETRARKVRARWKEQPTEVYWRIAIAKMAASSFCCQGKWASLDWLISNDTNHVKVMEGKYDDHDGQNKPSWMDTWKPPPDEGASQ